MPTIEIQLTTHAVDRFHERVRPTLSRAAAEDELARLVLFGEIACDPPLWHAVRQRSFASAYLVVGDLVLPLETRGDDAFVAVTCIARGGLSDRARAQRNARRRSRRHAGRVGSRGVRRGAG